VQYDIKEIFETVINPMWGENVLFLNDKPLDEGAVTEDHQAREEMVKIWRGAMEALAVERSFTVEPVFFFEVAERDPSGWQGRGVQAGKEVSLAEKLDGLGPRDIVVAVTGASITFELMRRQPAQGFRVVSSPGVHLEQKGFEADYAKIPLRFRAMAERIQKAEGAEVVFRGAGLSREPKLHIDLRGVRYKYLENARCHEPGRLVNLPSGCANCIPYRGEPGDARGASRTRGEAPVVREGRVAVFTFEEGRVTDIGGDEALREAFRAVVFRAEAPDMAFLGKLGIGLNEACAFSEPHVEKEKAVGIHWGMGNAKTFFTVYARENPVHVDLSFLYPRDEKETVMRDSRFEAAALGPAFDGMA